MAANLNPILLRTELQSSIRSRVKFGEWFLTLLLSWYSDVNSSRKYFLKINYFWLCWIFVAEWAFSSCREQVLLSSCCVRASLVAEHRLEGALDSVVVAPGLQSRDSIVGCMGLSALKHVGSSPTRDGTCVSLHEQEDSLSLEPPAKPKEVFLTRNKF